MMHRLLPCLYLFALTLRLAASESVLKVVAPDKTLSFTAAEFAALPHTELTATDPHTQARRQFSGVAVRELLTRIDAPLGDKLRGPALQLAVIAHAKDSYGVVFSLAEFDDAFSNRTILLADQEDGKPLAENAAPLRLILPGDKKAARLARMIVSLEIVSLAPVAQVAHDKE